MARIRGVKPELFRHEGLQELGERAMLVFIGLFTQADKEGRFRWQPKQLKLDILPFVDYDLGTVLDSLVHKGFIERYEVGAKGYGLITGFTKHQFTNGREPDSKLPPPPDSTMPKHVPDISSYTPSTGPEMFGHTESDKDRDKDGDGDSFAGMPVSSSRASESVVSSSPEKIRIAGEKQAVEEVFRYYLEKLGRDPQRYSLTSTRLRVGLDRLHDCMKTAKQPILENSARSMKAAIDGIALSDWHAGRDSKTNGKRYDDWTDNIFKSIDQMEKWWSLGEGRKPGGSKRADVLTELREMDRL